jgi:hypothetical protein
MLANIDSEMFATKSYFCVLKDRCQSALLILIAIDNEREGLDLALGEGE